MRAAASIFTGCDEERAYNYRREIAKRAKHPDAQ